MGDVALGVHAKHFATVPGGAQDDTQAVPGAPGGFVRSALSGPVALRLGFVGPSRALAGLLLDLRSGSLFPAHLRGKEVPLQLRSSRVRTVCKRLVCGFWTCTPIWRMIVRQTASCGVYRSNLRGVRHRGAVGRCGRWDGRRRDFGDGRRQVQRQQPVGRQGSSYFGPFGGRQVLGEIRHVHEVRVALGVCDSHTAPAGGEAGLPVFVASEC